MISRWLSVNGILKVTVLDQKGENLYWIQEVEHLVSEPKIYIIAVFDDIL